MRIVDDGLEIVVPDDDPRAAQIRAVLRSEVRVAPPAEAMWSACSQAHRRLLREIVSRGEVSQSELEAALGVDAVGLRGKTAGLARLCKRLRVTYPIRTAGSRREVRRFSLDPDVSTVLTRLIRKS